MALRKWAATMLFGAGLGLAGMLAPFLAPSPALAQTAPSLALQITSPATGASVSNPVTVIVTIAPLASSAGTTPAKPHHGGQVYLVVDLPAPAAHSIITADAKHIAFPKGQQQLSVTLPAGPHQLLAVAVNHKGKVLPRVEASAPVTITVQ
jgi:hypothetical protein